MLSLKSRGIVKALSERYEGAHPLLGGFAVEFDVSVSGMSQWFVMGWEGGSSGHVSLILS